MVILKDSPVYLLAGSEQFLKEENLARIKLSFLDKESQHFNFNLFYAPDTPVKKILECVNTLPFLGRKRLILVRQAEEISAPDKEPLLSYIKAPNSFACLVLETQEDDLSQNFLAQVRQYAQVIICKPLTDQQTFIWIKTRLQSKNKKIKERARAVLAENLGNDLQLLANALENLILYIGKRETIELADVEALVGRDLATTAFALFDAVIVRDRNEALQILDSLLKDGINSAQILGALSYQILSEKQKLKADKLRRCLQAVRKTDADIKTGRQGQRIALELLIVRLLEFV